MKKFTAFCQQSNGTGTIWIGEAEGETIEEAIEDGRRNCSRDWGWSEDRLDEIHCLGLAGGDIKIEFWDDLS